MYSSTVLLNPLQHSRKYMPLPEPERVEEGEEGYNVVFNDETEFEETRRYSFSANPSSPGTVEQHSGNQSSLRTPELESGNSSSPAVRGEESNNSSSPAVTGELRMGRTQEGNWQALSVFTPAQSRSEAERSARQIVDQVEQG